MSAADTSGVVRSIRSLLGFAALPGFVAARGGAAPAVAPQGASPCDFRAARARLLKDREADLVALRAQVNGILDASRGRDIASG